MSKLSNTESVFNSGPLEVSRWSTTITLPAGAPRGAVCHTVRRRQRFSFRAPRKPRKDTQVMTMPLISSMLAKLKLARVGVSAAILKFTNMYTPKPSTATPHIWWEKTCTALITKTLLQPFLRWAAPKQVVCQCLAQGHFFSWGVMYHNYSSTSTSLHYTTSYTQGGCIRLFIIHCCKLLYLIVQCIN